MKVLVVGMTPLPWKYHQVLQSKYVLQVRSVQKPFLDLIAQQQYDTTIIWSEKLSVLFTKKLLSHLNQEFPSLKTLVFGNHFSSLQRAELLSAGAKDCIPDSVCTQELIARIRNVKNISGQLTSKHLTKQAIFTHGNFQFDFKKKLAIYHHTSIPLNKKETLLLSTLLRKPNQIFSSQTLYNIIWNNTLPSSNSLEVYLCSLRRKIEKPFGIKLFTTFKGRGWAVII